MNAYVQENQPPGVPPLELTGERTLPDVPAENYWFRRHLVVYDWIAARVGGGRVLDMACGEGYGSSVLAGSALSVIGLDANQEAYEHARLRYRSANLSFERGMVETFGELGSFDAVVFLQTIEHVFDPVAVLGHLGSLLAPGTTISATIANEFTEAVGDLYTSALIALGLILFVITFIVLAAARYMLMRLNARIGA